MLGESNCRRMEQLQKNGGISNVKDRMSHRQESRVRLSQFDLFFFQFTAFITRHPLPLLFSRQYFVNVMNLLDSKRSDTNGWINCKSASSELTGGHLSSQTCSKPRIKFADENVYHRRHYTMLDKEQIFSLGPKSKA